MPARTVTIEVKMNITDAEGKITVLTGMLKAIGTESKKTGTEIDKTGKKTDDFERLVTKNLRQGETAFQSLTRRSSELRGEISKLQTTFARTGNKSIFGDLTSAENDLKKVKNFLGQMGDEGEKAGKTFLQQFVLSFRSLPEFAANPIGGAILATLAPAIISATSAALVTGWTFGVIGLAAEIEKDNPILVAAFTRLKNDAKVVLQGAAEPLVSPLANALDSVDSFIQRDGPALTAMFAEAAPSVQLIVAGFEKLGGDLIPVITRGVQSFTQAISNPAVAASLQEVESSLVGFLNELSSNPRLAEEGFIVLDTLLTTTFDILNLLVVATESFTDGLKFLGEAVDYVDTKIQQFEKDTHNLYDGFSPFLALLGDLPGKTNAAVVPFTTLGVVVQAAGDAGDATADEFNALGKAAGDLGDAIVNQLLSAFDDYIDKSLGVSNATIAFKDSLANLSAGLKENGKSFDINTKAGRANQQNLNDSIQKAKDSYDANITNNKGIAASSLAYQQQLDSIKKTLAAEGLNSKQIAELTRQYELLPAQKNTIVKALGTGAAQAGVDGVLGALGLLPHSVTIGVHLVGAAAVEAAAAGIRGALASVRARASGGIDLPNRDGGLYTHAANGLVNAGIYSPPTRYAFAEPQTGGEAFIPRLGNRARSMSILHAAAGWYNATVFPGSGGGGSGGAPIQITLWASDPQAKALLAGMRFAVQSNGGDVVKVLTPR